MLCKPATTILIISIAGVLFHIISRDLNIALSWAFIGLFGTSMFQLICFAGLEPLAWIFMCIPIMILCFFIAVALFASSVRIENQVPDSECST